MPTENLIYAGKQLRLSSPDARAVPPGSDYDPNVLYHCADCGAGCCNCPPCVKAKGRVNICAACARAKATKA